MGNTIYITKEINKCCGNLLVSGSSTLLSSLNVSGTTTLNGITTCNSSLNVSGTTRLNGGLTCVSSFNFCYNTM
jgi:hypothetical protein